MRIRVELSSLRSSRYRGRIMEYWNHGIMGDLVLSNDLITILWRALVCYIEGITIVVKF